MGGLSHQPPAWQAGATQNTRAGAGVSKGAALVSEGAANARASANVLRGFGLPGGGLVAQASHTMREL